MRSDNLRPVSPERLAELGLAPAPFEIIPDPPGQAPLLQWNTPKPVPIKQDYRPRVRPVTAPKAVQFVADPAPALPDHKVQFAKQLIGFARSLSDAEIAKAARLPIETVRNLRGANEA